MHPTLSNVEKVARRLNGKAHVKALDVIWKRQQVWHGPDGHTGKLSDTISFILSRVVRNALLNYNPMSDVSDWERKTAPVNGSYVCIMRVHEALETQIDVLEQAIRRIRRLQKDIARAYR